LFLGTVATRIINEVKGVKAVSIKDRESPEASRRLDRLSIPLISSQTTDLCTNMARTHIDKRSRLVSAAVGLAYQNGFGATSLADIAREAEVPLGNVYYYFKTKDDIGEAIVELRLAQLLLASSPNWPAPGPSESPAGRRSVPMSETNSASMPRSITGQQGSRKSWPYPARAASTSILKTLAARSGRRFCRCSIASRGCRCVASSPITTAPPGAEQNLLPATMLAVLRRSLLLRC
jgi:hypothetical protein